MYLTPFDFKYPATVPRKEVSVVGMASGAFICLVATALGMTDPERFGNLCLALFAIAFLVFYVSVAMPIRWKRRPSDNS